MDAKEAKIFVNQIEAGFSGLMGMFNKSMEDLKKNLSPEQAEALANQMKNSDILKEAKKKAAEATEALNQVKSKLK